MYEALGSPDMRTPEGFLKALEDAKKMFPDVNGQPLIPFGLHDFHEKETAPSRATCRTSLPFRRIKTESCTTATDPEYVRWLKTFRMANEKGLMSKDIFVDKRPQMEEKSHRAAISRCCTNARYGEPAERIVCKRSELGLHCSGRTG